MTSFYQPVRLQVSNIRRIRFVNLCVLIKFKINNHIELFSFSVHMWEKLKLNLFNLWEMKVFTFMNNPLNIFFQYKFLILFFTKIIFGAIKSVLLFLLSDKLTKIPFTNVILFTLCSVSLPFGGLIFSQWMCKMNGLSFHS